MQTDVERIEIPLSKSKLFLMLLGSLVFVAIGLWFVIAPPTTAPGSFWTTSRIIVAGYASIVFFGICAIFIARKLFDNKPGLIIDHNGFTDNSSGLSVGQIAWRDIEKFSVINIRGQKLIMLDLKNPKDYIDLQTNSFKKRIMLMNHKMYGSPISITSNGLKISFDELFKLLNSRLQSSSR